MDSPRAMLSSLKSYARHMGGWGLAIVGGSVVSAALIAWELSTGKGISELPPWILWTVLFGGLIIGPFIAYHRLRMRSIALVADAEVEADRRIGLAEKRADDQNQLAREMLENNTRLVDRNTVLAERHARLLGEHKDVLRVHNKLLSDGTEEEITPEMRLEWRYRQAAAELRALILEGETRPRPLFGGDYEAKKWLEKLSQFGDRAFRGELHRFFCAETDGSGIGDMSKRADKAIAGALATLERFTTDDLDDGYGRR